MSQDLIYFAEWVGGLVAVGEMVHGVGVGGRAAGDPLSRIAARVVARRVASLDRLHDLGSHLFNSYNLFILLVSSLSLFLLVARSNLFSSRS